jgi:hypothetical protein
MQIDSVVDADHYNTSWQSRAQGPPTAAYYAGLNLLATAPAADTGPYSLLATVVQNAPLPANDAAYLQVARDDFDAVIDYAQHLAAFKMGGSDFAGTMPLLQRFLTQGALYGLKLKEIGEYTDALYGLGTRERDLNPVMQPDTTGQGGPV